MGDEAEEADGREEDDDIILLMMLEEEEGASTVALHTGHVRADCSQCYKRQQISEKTFGA